MKAVGERGIVFTSHELGCPTNVVLLQGKEHAFLCDTYLGPLPMESVKKYITSPLVVFNSHSHWDHVWGNCAFPSSVLLSHSLCRQKLEEEGESELEEYKEYAMGEVKIVLPTLTFDLRMPFPEDDVEFFYTPGHTKDSASCLCQDVLFAGDNVEEPIPYLFYEDLDAYLHTLEEYADMECIVIPGHGSVSDNTLVRENLEYVEAFKENDTEKYENQETYYIHQMNVKIQENLRKR